MLKRLGAAPAATRFPHLGAPLLCSRIRACAQTGGLLERRRPSSRRVLENQGPSRKPGSPPRGAAARIKAAAPHLTGLLDRSTPVYLWCALLPRLHRRQESLPSLLPPGLSCTPSALASTPACAGTPLSGSPMRRGPSRPGARQDAPGVATRVRRRSSSAIRRRSCFSPERPSLPASAVRPPSNSLSRQVE